MFCSGQVLSCHSSAAGCSDHEEGFYRGEGGLYMLAMAEYGLKDYETASEYFKKYYSSYPKGLFAENAKYFVGESLYQNAPEPRLDESTTYTAISAFQEYLDLFPDARFKAQATERLYALQDLLVEKEYKSANLYFGMGTYFGNCTEGGNNYEACIVTAQNALKDYPYSNKREEFTTLIMKSKYELAKMSVESKQLERYQDAEDECYGFINEYPDSKDVPLPRMTSRNARNSEGSSGRYARKTGGTELMKVNTTYI